MTIFSSLLDHFYFENIPLLQKRKAVTLTPTFFNHLDEIMTKKLSMRLLDYCFTGKYTGYELIQYNLAQL
jgi:hypothetical protein